MKIKFKLYTLDNKFIDKNIFPNNFTGFIKYSDGTKQWYLNGKLHRVGGHAIENADGTPISWINRWHNNPYWLRYKNTNPQDKNRLIGGASLKYQFTLVKFNRTGRY